VAQLEATLGNARLAATAHDGNLYASHEWPSLPQACGSALQSSIESWCNKIHGRGLHAELEVHLGEARQEAAPNGRYDHANGPIHFECKCADDLRADAADPLALSAPVYLLHPGSKALQKPNSGVRQRHAAHRPMQQPNPRRSSSWRME